MNVASTSPRVAVVGAGPVGAYVALGLARAGVDVTVFERRTAPASSSRSIGIHPPGLEALAEIGVAPAMVERGVHVHHAEAWSEGRRLGSLTFDSCPDPYRYVLTLPQCETETVLRRAMQARSRIEVVEGEVVAASPCGESAVVRLRTERSVEARTFAAVVACDGKRSAVRRSLGIAFEGGEYAGSYAMADFPDHTGLGSMAAIYLARSGLLESFPLPGGLRRWVSRCVPGEAASTDDLIVHVAERANVGLSSREALHPSAFHAERWCARELALGSIALAGDAAHVVSPIGGQGMNLGWLGARSIVRALVHALERGTSIGRALALDARARRRAARLAARRAELNMWLGRPTTSPTFRDALITALLRAPTRHVLARLFTMRGLRLGIV
jgi:2-polyprenyl-6-methoxyphenol hydroxylase-like FAD-dependent oxidoreductase